MSYETFEKEYQREQTLARKANEANKAAILNTLAAAGITNVAVCFDGSGDDGQIESVEARIGETLVEIAPTPVLTCCVPSQLPWRTDRQPPMLNEDGLEIRFEPLPEAIESLCYGLLEQKYVGWEINDGAFGEFILDVPQHVIRLQINYRTVEESEDEF